MRKLITICLLTLTIMIGTGPASAQWDQFETGQKANSPKPSQPSKCDVLWAKVKQETGRSPEQDYRNFARQCPGSALAKEALKRANAMAERRQALVRRQEEDAFRRQEQARADEALRQQAANCSNELVALTKNESATALSQFDSFALRCPANAASAEALALKKNLVAKSTLDTELKRWNLTSKQLCGLGYFQILKMTNFAANKANIESWARRGDSVANLLMGMDAEFQYFKTGIGWQISAQYYRAASLAGNPRSLVTEAEDKIFRPVPDYAAADYLLIESRQHGCAAASYVMSEITERAGAKPVWTSTARTANTPAATILPVLSRTALLDEAIDGGFGYAACRRVELAGNAWTPATRQIYYRKATEAGSRCAELMLVAEGYPANNASSLFGPCAGSASYNECAFSEYSRLSGLGIVNAGYYAYSYQIVLSNYKSPIAYNKLIPPLQLDAELGNTRAMAVLGFLELTGRFSGVTNKGIGQGWCLRAHALGDPYGAACLGIFGGYGKASIEQAYAMDTCAPFFMARMMLPISSKVLQAPEIRTIVQREYLEAERNSLRQALPLVGYAVNLDVKSNPACSYEQGSWRSNWSAIFGKGI